MTRRAKELGMVGILCLAAGALGGYILSTSHVQNTRPLREHLSDYPYISPLLVCDTLDGGWEQNTSLQKSLDTITTEAEHQGTIAAGSVYYRDLNSGQWAGVNEDAPYTPASLLKVPILIAYYKAAEARPSLLAERASYQQLPDDAPPLVEHPILTSGHTYSVLDLLRGMIIDSDNTAKTMLEGGIDKQTLTNTYAELGIPSPYTNPQTDADYVISARTYGLFFRILYSATYLNQDNSEQALEMLSQVSFDKGLRAGTPANIPIAHKYGYYIAQKDPAKIELSDCGIVYDPNKPYLLCVMAKGSDPDDTATYIKDVASVVYSATH